ncbi:unnamed protein product [Menidia menidia]|uniref:(Atlantic silverside) hypothetical protein n=1 Tax=Menidia menidia TaxID=238744 RepID=A0A8S4AMZ0_9TELE|nr:unnamed protein product [Menidia menidia]
MKQLQKPGKGTPNDKPHNFSQTLNRKEHRGLNNENWQVPDQDTDRNSLSSSENSMFNGPIEFPNMKRHSEGTFSNDYSKYLETRRAQDFVQWLKNSKRNGSLLRRHADGTYTSDVSSYLQDQAAKEFVSWLKTGRGRRE